MSLWGEVGISGVQVSLTPLPRRHTGVSHAFRPLSTPSLLSGGPASPSCPTWVLREIGEEGVRAGSHYQAGCGVEGRAFLSSFGLFPARSSLGAWILGPQSNPWNQWEHLQLLSSLSAGSLGPRVRERKGQKKQMGRRRIGIRAEKMIHLDRIDSWNHSFIHSLILWIKQTPVLGTEGNRNL